ncbi:MAG: hypothetical protein ABJE47_02640 [bacterium]
MLVSRSFTRFTTFGIAITALGVLGAARPEPGRTAVLAGPPWISIETPVNPYDATTRSAFLVVHAFHHGDPVAFPVSGTAEGIVNGERRSIALEFTTTSRTGAYALKKQWGDAGVWTLVIKVTQHENDVAQALVELGSDGAVTRVQVPTRVGERSLPFPRELSAREIDTALKERVKLTAVSRRS